MKTLEEISKQILANSPNNMTDRDCWKVIATLYAKEVATVALKDAAENATVFLPSHPALNGTKSVDILSILNTEIKLP